jgi:protein MpaA
MPIASSSIRAPAPSVAREEPHPARPPRTSRSIHDLLAPLVQLVAQSEVLRADSLGCWRSGDDLLFLPRFFFQRRKVHKPRIKVGIFAGIHGDEPGSVVGLIRLARALESYPEMGRNYQLWLYPLCNPSGYIDGTRESRSGKDLNREFWKNSPEPEVRLLETEIRRQRFNGLIQLHCDDTSYGVYGFGGGALNELLLKQGLSAAEHALPRNAGSCIDGFAARDGIIDSRYDGILSAPTDQNPAPFEVVFETPHHASIRRQGNAFLFGLHAILAEYRQLMCTTET